MKYTVILFCLSLTLTQSTSAKKMSDREHEGFKGPVRKVFEESSTITEGSNSSIGARCPILTQTYDRQGRLTTIVLYPGSCGSEEIRHNCSYDKNGNRLERIDGSKAGGIPISPQKPSTASGGGNQNGSYHSKHGFKYDSKGRISEKSEYSPDGKLTQKTVYKYDAQNRLVEEAYIDPDGSLSEKEMISYRGSGLLPSESISIGNNGKPYSKETYSDYEVNSHGDWTKRRGTEEHLNQPNRAKTITVITRTIEYY